MARRWFTRSAVIAALAAAFAGAASAQSLDPGRPTPLAPGENRGVIDNMVGAQYWSFKYRKGAGRVSVRFTSMGLFGNRQTTTIQIVVRTPTGQVVEQRSLTSSGQVAELNMPGNFPGSGSYVLGVLPTGMALVRAGGDYSITVDGPAIDYAGVAAAGPERIAGTYSVMVCPPDFDCQASLAIRFAANGTVQTTDGHSGTWKVFDPDALIYSVVVGRDRWSLKLIPGRGLVGTNDPSVVVFQAVR